ncbi:ribonuclease regulator [Vibrio sp. vnigr-6D03]|uniref:ribonuclease regulator n=1 Tax=Vibrio TaxID=662 RepID=UPI000C32E189|nr:MULTISPECIES: ribonuclease regulator [Vibrio]MDP2573885.1 ribonuclease regulator [Vibrio penaeicida]PKF79161.1 ribonuclease regulator [Vibrio sp. vnigr-6D03]
MKKLFLVMSLLAIPATSFAESLPLLNPEKPSSHSWFISSQSQPNTQFDSWQIDSGYSYNLFDSVDLYVGASITNSESPRYNGFLSGVNYTFNESFSVNSSLRASKSYEDNSSNPQEKLISAELSSRLKLSENLDIHATLDYEELQKGGVEVGLGFRF